ncbi:MAG: uroporphyrinogen decarboxylase [Candidatus Bathyarchaeota archaeon]|nr:uroporphyrinogen decarboxylase [Candidatus Bathyarchaeota archaeon]
MTLDNTTLLDACRRKQPAHTPVWFMRQAGRYMPSYKQLKGNLQITELAKNSELASEVAIDAVNRLGVDACILFADIMLPLEGLGFNFKIEENVGPVMQKPICTLDDVKALKEFDAERDMGYISDTIELTLQKLEDSVPLIGFSGAPFTLASYMIDGIVNKDLVKTKQLMYGQPETWQLLMEKLTKMVQEYLCFQVKHGVHAIQLFDSWAGCLSCEDYNQFVSKYTHTIFASIPKVPKIHFCADSGALIEQFQKAGADVLSVDWRVPLEDVWRRCREQVAVQGNMDPAAALAGGEFMKRKTKHVLEAARPYCGHIFSLGHGVLKETAPENLQWITEKVHNLTSSRR